MGQVPQKFSNYAYFMSTTWFETIDTFDTYFSGLSTDEKKAWKEKEKITKASKGSQFAGRSIFKRRSSCAHRQSHFTVPLTVLLRVSMRAGRVCAWDGRRHKREDRDKARTGRSGRSGVRSSGGKAGRSGASGGVSARLFSEVRVPSIRMRSLLEEEVVCKDIRTLQVVD
ncbi:hypothetical protein B0H14DRAFT_2609965 [Mycena olivaceomarginata]|nr:hypothetical protein B0H14DRAFT_2609965 [Mycena olivaceomarginata]